MQIVCDLLTILHLDILFGNEINIIAVVSISTIEMNRSMTSVFIHDTEDTSTKNIA